MNELEFWLKRLLSKPGHEWKTWAPGLVPALKIRNDRVRTGECLGLLDTTAKVVVSERACGVNYTPWKTPPAADTDAEVKIFAFYRETPLALARGAESAYDYWRQVVRRKPAVAGQRLPLLPDQSGFYDPCSVESVTAQMRLAQTYGISGFCAEYSALRDYSRSPSSLESLLTHDGPNIPAFAYIDVSVLDRPFSHCRGLRQRSLAKFLLHERYLRIDGRPVIAFRGLLATRTVESNLAAIIQSVVAVCKREPLVIWIGQCGSEGLKLKVDQYILDFAPFLEPPDDAGRFAAACMSGNRETSDAVYSFPRIVKNALDLSLRSVGCPWDHVLTGFDESRDDGWSRHVVHASPSIFERWLREGVRRQQISRSPFGKFVFISSWNDWTRTSALEPNTTFGHGYGLAVHNSVEFAKRLAAGTAVLHEETASPVPSAPVSDPEHEKSKLEDISLEEKVSRFRAAHKSLHLDTNEVEADLADLLASPPDKPVFVYQMGKVGSISIMHGLGAIGETDRNGTTTIFTARGESSVQPVFHLHALAGLDEVALNIATQYPDPKVHLKEIERGRRIRDWIKTADEETRWNVISLTREPIGRNISAFFHDVEQMVPNLVERYTAGDIGAEEMRELFVYLYTQNAHKWFDYHMKPIFGVDVFAHPFDPEMGYTIIEEGQTRLLVMRMEDMNRCAPPAMEKFLGVKDFRVERENTSEEKAYYGLIKAFKELPLPKEFVDDLLDAKFARHFYSPAEIEKLKRRYIKN